MATQLATNTIIIFLLLLRVPIVGRVQYGYITPAFSGSLEWGEINSRVQVFADIQNFALCAPHSLYLVKYLNKKDARCAHGASRSPCRLKKSGVGKLFQPLPSGNGIAWKLVQSREDQKGGWCSAPASPDTLRAQH